VTEPLHCWCGNTELLDFSSEYRRCPVCETLVLTVRGETPLDEVRDDESDFYGKRYWFEHQEQELGFSNLLTRVRQDLPERCVHWLRTLLRYKLPPLSTLELGSSHGAFVALLRWAGFDASGLEMSPWVADFARRTFDIPMFVGPLETHAIEPASLGVVSAMDVVEHLTDPITTLQHAVRVLRPDGLLLLQTPCYPAGKTYEALRAASSPFLAQLKAPEHLHLLSEQAMRELLRRVGMEHVQFEPAIFAHYDMFVAASRQPLRATTKGEIEAALAASASGRLLQALVDIYEDRAAALADLAEEHAHVGWLKQSIDELERDRAARLSVLEQQGIELGQISTLEADIAHLKELVHAAEEDRAARLTVIEQQGHELGRIGALEADVAYLKQQIETMEAARGAQLSIIELQREELARIPELNAQVSSLQRSRDEREQQLGVLKTELASTQQRGAELERQLADLSRSRLVRFLRTLGVFR
jgi:SAM-dependent methyltransferase